MTFVYIVRCRFSKPAKEAAWNAWYSGPKIADMLAKPHFLSCQRFRRSAGTGRDYLTLWTLSSPEAFKTKEYNSDWGWFEWRPYITDWSRDLFDAGDAPVQAFAVPAEATLHVMAFDGLDMQKAQAAKANAPADMMWLPVIGLNQHTPLIGVKVRPDAAAAPQKGAASEAAVYAPMCELQTPR
jgi:hypothetical protein